MKRIVSGILKQSMHAGIVLFQCLNLLNGVLVYDRHAAGSGIGGLSIGRGLGGGQVAYLPNYKHVSQQDHQGYYECLMSA